jgi:hypothetical protein
MLRYCFIRIRCPRRDIRKTTTAGTACAPPSSSRCVVDLAHGKMHVNRVKSGSPSVHPISGVESRALRRLKRESAESPFVFVSEFIQSLLPKEAANAAH